MIIYKERQLKSTCNNRFLIRKDRPNRYLVLWNGVTTDGGMKILSRLTEPIKLEVISI